MVYGLYLLCFSVYGIDAGKSKFMVDYVRKSQSQLTEDRHVLSGCNDVITEIRD